MARRAQSAARPALLAVRDLTDEPRAAPVAVRNLSSTARPALVAVRNLSNAPCPTRAAGDSGANTMQAQRKHGT